MALMSGNFPKTYISHSVPLQAEEWAEDFARNYAKAIPLARSLVFHRHFFLVLKGAVPKETGFEWASRVLGREITSVEDLFMLTDAEIAGLDGDLPAEVWLLS